MDDDFQADQDGSDRSIDDTKERKRLQLRSTERDGT